MATLVGIGALVAFSALTEIPASASQPDIKIDSSSNYQYYRYCDYNQTPPPCNLQGGTQLVFDVWNANGGAASTVGYTIINGSAVDGVDFSIPMTGTINVPSGGGTGGLVVPVVNEGGSDVTETFTVKLSTGATATGTIMPQSEVPADCALSAPDGTTIAITCTGRPAGQTWYAYAYCLAFGIRLRAGAEVTGDGTSTVYCGAYAPYSGAAWFGALS
jgi:hypothetical protein